MMVGDCPANYKTDAAVVEEGIVRSTGFERTLLIRNGEDFRRIQESTAGMGGMSPTIGRHFGQHSADLV